MFLHPPDLAGAGQEHEHVALVAGQRVADGARHPGLDSSVRRSRRVADLDGDSSGPRCVTTGASPSSRLTRWPSSVADMTRSRRSGRRIALGLERERQAEVGVQAALVELVEDDQAVLLEAPGRC